MARFSLRIVDVEYYLERPVKNLDTCYSEFRQRDIYKVPVIRIFGSTPKGQRCCLHIHNVYPYFYTPLPSDVGDIYRFTKEFAVSLDLALQAALGRSTSHQQMYVLAVEVVSKKPYYGYHEDEINFLKVSINNPVLIKRCSEVLLNGCVLNRIFQPYETHIPYILQFLMDYNLYGMNLLHLKHIHFRLPLPQGNCSGKLNVSMKSPLRSPLGSPLASQANFDEFFEQNVPSSMTLAEITKQTRCTLEADASGKDILNQLMIKDCASVNPGLNGIWEDEKQRRRDQMQSSIIELPLSQARGNVQLTEKEDYQLAMMRAAITERLEAMNMSSIDSLRPNIDSSDDGSGNQTCDVLCSSMDQGMVDVLANLADDDEDDNNMISNTPLLEATFINNGLSDHENNTEDDEEAETLHMTQQIYYPDEKDDETDLDASQKYISDDEASCSWMTRIPQLDGCLDHNDDTKLSNTNPCKNSNQSPSENSCLSSIIRENDIEDTLLRKKQSNTMKQTQCKKSFLFNHMPQLDGNSDIFDSNSDDDFKVKRKRKTKYSKRKKRKLSFIAGLDDDDNCDGDIDYEFSIAYTPKHGKHKNKKNEKKIETTPKQRRQSQGQKSSEYIQKQKSVEFDPDDFEDLKESICGCGSDTTPIRNKSRIKIEKYNLKPLKIVVNDVLKASKDDKRTKLVSPTCCKQLSSNSNKIDSLSGSASTKSISVLEQKTNSSSNSLFENVEKVDIESDSVFETSICVASHGKDNNQGTSKASETFFIHETTSNRVERSCSMKICSDTQSEEDNNQNKKDNTMVNKFCDKIPSETISIFKNNFRNKTICSETDTGEEDVNLLNKKDIGKDKKIDDHVTNILETCSGFPKDENRISEHSSNISDEDRTIDLNEYSTTFYSTKSWLSSTDSSTHDALYTLSFPSPIKEKNKLSTPRKSSLSSSSIDSPNKSSTVRNLSLSFDKQTPQESKTLRHVISPLSITQRINTVTSIILPGKILTDSYDSQLSCSKELSQIDDDSKNERTMADDDNLLKGIRYVPSEAYIDNQKLSQIDSSKIIKTVSGGDSNLNLKAMREEHKQSSCKDSKVSLNLISMPGTTLKLESVCETDKQNKVNHNAQNVVIDFEVTSKPEPKSDVYVPPQIVKNVENSVTENEEQLKSGAGASSENDPCTSQSSNYDGCTPDLDVCSSQKSSSDDGSSFSISSVVLSQILSAAMKSSTDKSSSEEDLISSQQRAVFEDDINDNTLVGEVPVSSKLPSLKTKIDSNFRSDLVQSLKDPAYCIIYDPDEQAALKGTSDKSTLKGNVSSLQKTAFQNDKCDKSSFSGEILVQSQKRPANYSSIEQDLVRSQKPPSISDSCGASDENSCAVPHPPSLDLSGDSTPEDDSDQLSKKILLSKVRTSRGSFKTSKEIQGDETRKDIKLTSQQPSCPKSTDQNSFDESLYAFQDPNTLKTPALTPDSPRFFFCNSSSNDSPPSFIEKEPVQKPKYCTDILPGEVLHTSQIPTCSKYTLCYTPTDDEMSESILKDDDEAAHSLAPNELVPTKYQLKDQGNEERQCNFPNECNNSIIITPKFEPPSREYVISSLVEYNLPEVRNVQPFYSDENDVRQKTGVYHGQHIATSKPKVSELPKCELSTSSNGAFETFLRKQEQELIEIIGVENAAFTPSVMFGDQNIVMTPAKPPPRPSKVKQWLMEHGKPNELIKKASGNVNEYSSSNQSEGNQSLLKVKSPNDSGIIQPSPGKEPHPVLKRGAYSIKFQLSMKGSNDSEIEGVSLNNTYGFDVTHHNVNEAKTLHVNQHLTVLSVEIHAATRRDFKPDPTMDQICAIFYHICRDTTHNDTQGTPETGVFICDPDHVGDSNQSRAKLKRSLISQAGVYSFHVHTEATERDLILKFVSFVQELDPDLIVGYEVQMLSWGYLIERSAALNINICQLLSRVVEHENERLPVRDDPESDIGFGMLVNMSISGRIVLNVWRIMRSEVTLQKYSFENVYYHVVHQRTPFYSCALLTDWWKQHNLRWRVCNYYVIRCQGNIKLMNQIDFINRTSELARLFGITFYNVISRGSQFRVESMMLRIAKPLNFVPVSPSVHQRAKMPAPECIALVVEPESCLYVDPVIVLDFQSLYPSIIIAYNYCYSTCLGRLHLFSQNEQFNFGATNLNLPLKTLKKLAKKDIHVSPNGVGFVKSNVLKGILPRMLEEILNTRIMVKGAMKLAKEDKVLYKMLDSRQLGLKLIANVTYGYTAANFSGRMPCIEIGDSVVRKGRETLERAIELIHSTKRWNAKVVYGDTDSLFVLLKGASKERAFALAKEMVDEVTARNPKPVKLKFEKVYQPCVLIAKKRYVGYMYESLNQKEPEFDAKGIETVRRDNCPALGKILEKCLRLLFEKKDVSLIKRYVQKQFTKIMEERVMLKDFIFAKEYHGMNRYKPGACVPSLTLSRKMLKYDRRSEPRVGERVPYVIIYGSPGLPLIQLVRTPLEVLTNNTLRLNGVYYITKQICPALSRVFSLFGVNVFTWFTDLPKVSRSHDRGCEVPGNTKGMISQYFTSNHCVICEDLTTLHLCTTCRASKLTTSVLLNDIVSNSERRLINLTNICRCCSGCDDARIGCTSLDCPVFYKLSKRKTKLHKNELLRKLLLEL